ncbi:ferrous iron transport protein B [Butyrivibrio sp. CB08]|uniref:ferrous iron transport protein B n=1 Tax=Butyrivibrio sp. CB08 TaxID=2364879 RepID=UPI000EA97631|nr:ferrous iron transport protein B [Butyrivibrio sp. CB08]RKM59237.1 ferrous iron transport protein B [Butyrivibrio sp. CB08]
MNLDALKPGQSARILTVGGQGALRQHFLDMGVIPGAEVTTIKLAPMGDPMELRIHGYELTLRLADAQQIEIEPIEKVEAKEEKKDAVRHTEHPGLGEEGRFHPKGSGDPLPEGTTLTFALVGNQNSGKTSLFNQLTGSNQHVGNFPGVTVDRKDGVIRDHADTLITDLPGIYSMSPYSSEERVSRDFVLKEKPKGIINIVDATNIERNLYLTMQLLRMNIPMVVALNMMDEMRGNGGTVDVNTMEAMLGVPVVPISAAKNEGVDELVRHAIHVAKNQERPIPQDFCSPDDRGGAVHRAFHAVCHLIEDHAKAADIPCEFAASKLLEGEQEMADQLQLDTNEKELLEHIILQMEKECGLDHSAAVANMRFDYIKRVCDSCVIKPHESKEHIRSQKIDKILTGRYTAIPMFVGIMALVFYLTFFLIGPFFQGLLETAIDSLKGLVDFTMDKTGVTQAIQSLVLDGIFEGVGTVVSFLPIIVILFFFLSMLEDSGYIARVAFVMDKLLRHMGLSGRSIVPMLLGFGCTVPAVMSTRTLPSERDRKMTILLTPFMSCTAKLPIYGFFVAAFFPKQSWIIITGLYLLGILTGIIMAYLLKFTLFKGEAVPFVMELPNYRVPTPRNVIQLLWEKAKDFLHRAFSIILIATIVVWFLKSFDFGLNLVSDSHTSMLATISGIFAPIMKPIGLGDWRIVTSLISGFMAKESVVSVMETLFSDGLASLGALSAASMLTFSLLYTPCVAAVAAISRELGKKWAICVVLWQCCIAWLGALAVRLIGLAIGMQ